MLKKLPIIRTIIEKRHQQNIAHCRSLISKNKANYGYFEMNGHIPTNFKFNSPCIHEPFLGSEILHIKEISSDYFAINYSERIYIGQSYDGMFERFKVKYIVSLKIEKGDPLFDKIKKELEDDKRNVKKIMFNHKLSELEKLKEQLRSIEEKIQKKKTQLQEKRSTVNEFYNPQVKNIPLFEDDQLRDLQNDKKEIERKIKASIHSIEHFDFSGDIYKTF